jgi:NADPH:quinone reductase-like Zn-dependent oxidoreductase
MKAVIQSAFGPAADVLSIQEIPEPTPGAGQLLVDVDAVGIAKGNWLITHGLPYIARPMYGFRTPKQPLIGLQFAGVIAALGAGVTGFNVGDAVFGSHSGTLAERIVVPTTSVVRTPDRVSAEQAAASPISGVTALQAVRDGARVNTGQHVLVLGASGGVGSFVVQMAKAFGAIVTGVAGPANQTLLRELGADHVIDYSSQDPLAGSPNYDVIIDLAGNRPVSRLRKALTPKGTLVIVGGTGGRWTMGFGRTIGAMLLAPFVKQRLVGFLANPTQADLAVLADLMSAGRVSPVVRRVYPIDDVVDAVESAGRNSGAGTPVVRIRTTDQSRATAETDLR